MFSKKADKKSPKKNSKANKKDKKDKDKLSSRKGKERQDGSTVSRTSELENEDTKEHDDDHSGSPTSTHSHEHEDSAAEDNNASKKNSHTSDDNEEPSQVSKDATESHSNAPSQAKASEDDSTSTAASKLRHRVKKFKKIRVKRKKFQVDREDEEKQRTLQAKYDEMVHDKAKREERAGKQAAFADFSAVGLTTEQLDKKFIKKLYPVILLGKVCGRYPLSHNWNEIGLTFHYNNKYPFAVYFLFANICLTILFLAGGWSVFSFWMEMPVGIDYRDATQNAKIYWAEHVANMTVNTANWTEEEITKLYLRNRPERYVYDRNIISFITTWGFLFHNIISGWHFWWEMPYIIKYFNFWLKAVHTMNIDATQAAVVPALVGIGFAIVITGLFVPASFVKALPSLCGMPASIAIIVGRDFLPGLMEPVNPSKRSFGGLFDALYIFGICLHAYLMMSSYFFVLLCMTVCKYLRNAFLMWNGRVYSSLLRGGDYIHSKEGRSTYALLYKDHATLLDLVEGTDRVFVYILESFTGLSILSLCLELYFIIRTAQKGYSEKAALEGGFFVRKHDWIAGGILTIQHGVMLIMALRITSSVGEEAMAGLEIIRRKTMLGRKADEELYFMLSMFSSYTSDNPIALCGGGFFVCNKEYIIGVVATIISYFTLVFQFEPQLDFNPTAGVDTSREKIQEFIDRLERPLLWDP